MVTPEIIGACVACSEETADRNSAFTVGRICGPCENSMRSQAYEIALYCEDDAAADAILRRKGK